MDGCPGKKEHHTDKEQHGVHLLCPRKLPCYGMVRHSASCLAGDGIGESDVEDADNDEWEEELDGKADECVDKMLLLGSPILKIEKVFKNSLIIESD